MILVPYLLSAAFAFKVSLQDGSPRKKRYLTISGVAVAYSFWLLYAAGVSTLLLSSLLYAPGVFVYIKAQRRRGGVFYDAGVRPVQCPCILCCSGRVCLYTGRISL